MTVLYHQGGFPPADLRWPELIPLIGPANAAVARYDGVLHGIPNPNVLLSPLTSQEAVLSSRIEGTQATLGEVLEYEASGDQTDESTPQKADIREVLNYRGAALNEALRLLDDLPLSQRLIRQTHAVLMQGVRGRNKAPGGLSPRAKLDRPRGLHHGTGAVRALCGRSSARRDAGMGRVYARHRPPTVWCNWRSCMPSLRRSTRFWMATGGLGGC